MRFLAHRPVYVRLLVASVALVAVLMAALFILSRTYKVVAHDRIDALIAALEKKHGIALTVGKKRIEGTVITLERVKIKKPTPLTIDHIEAKLDLKRVASGMKAIQHIIARGVNGRLHDLQVQVEEATYLPRRKKLTAKISGAHYSSQQAGLSLGWGPSRLELDHVALTSTHISARFASFHQHVTAAHPHLDARKVTLKGILHSGQVRLARPSLNLQIKQGSIGVGKLQLDYSLTKSGAENQVLTAQLNLPRTACSDLYAAMVDSIAPDLQGFTVAGHLSGTFDAELSTAVMQDFKIKANPKFTCRLTQEPVNLAALHLRGVRPPLVNKDNPIQRSQLFTPLKELSPALITATLAAEDIRFFTHNGFEFGLIEEALRNNLKESQVAFGGSTISMQTAKNIFLRYEKTLVRKIKEAFLTWYLESTLTKERLLEIYLNIVEFGPGIFGVTEAAQHFFAKAPGDLTLLESTYLASVLPSPRKRYRHYCRGHLSPSYQRFVHSRLKTMIDLKQIDARAYQTARSEFLQFAPNRDLRRCRTAATRRRATQPEQSL